MASLLFGPDGRVELFILSRLENGGKEQSASIPALKKENVLPAGSLDRA